MGVEARWLHDEGVTLYGSVLPGLYAAMGHITCVCWVVNGGMRRIRACCSEILRSCEREGHGGYVPGV